MSDHQGRSGKFVCAACLEEDGLKEFAHKHGALRACDYCGETPGAPCVVAIDRVTEFMAEAIGQEWCDPAATSPVDGGKYVLPTIDNSELFEHIGFQVENSELMDDLLAAFNDHDWCEANWQILEPSKRWKYGWERFQHVVKHQRRYTFWQSREDLEDVSHPDHLPPAEMLDEVGAVLTTAKLVMTLPEGTLFWRLRLHEKIKVLKAADEFAAPRTEHAKQPNRMSPAGVPMFYSCDDFATAFLELVDPNDPATKNQCVTGAQFRNLISLNLLDLIAIPSPPSYFAPGAHFRRHGILFLRQFAASLSQPIKRDGREHIEYVPTQVFTEFVRHIMKGPNGEALHGIRYSSSKDGRPCYVIFATHEECLPPHGPLDATTQKLEFVPGTIKRGQT